MAKTLQEPGRKRLPREIRLKLDWMKQKQKRGGRSICRPFKVSGGETYFRLVIAVRSADSLTMPVAPHQLEPTPDGLMLEKLPLKLAV